MHAISVLLIGFADRGSPRGVPLACHAQRIAMVRAGQRRTTETGAYLVIRVRKLIGGVCGSASQAENAGSIPVTRSLLSLHDAAHVESHIRGLVVPVPQATSRTRCPDSVPPDMTPRS